MLRRVRGPPSSSAWAMLLQDETPATARDRNVLKNKRDIPRQGRLIGPDSAYGGENVSPRSQAMVMPRLEAQKRTVCQADARGERELCQRRAPTPKPIAVRKIFAARHEIYTRMDIPSQ